MFLGSQLSIISDNFYNLSLQNLDSDFCSIGFTETRYELYHSSEPWQQYKMVSAGNVYFKSSSYFYKIDSTITGKRTLFSKTYYNGNDLLINDYGDTNFLQIRKSELETQILENIRYSPIIMSDYIYMLQSLKASFATNEIENQKVYYLKIGENRVSVFYNLENHNILKLVKVAINNHHDMIGDNLTTIYYNKYNKFNELDHPSEIIIEKSNKKSIDTILIGNVNVVDFDVIPRLVKPKDFKWQEEMSLLPDSIWVSKYNDYLTFIHFKKADSRIAVVEFPSYFVVIGAPLKPENGELIIQELRKLNTTKLIKYFAFGHHHPHYLGGVRAFANIGSKIICLEQNSKYLNYLLNNPHSMKPDSLQISKNVPIITYIKDSVEIKDGNLEMKIYHIGKKSAHANDFLVFYFPNDKLLLQDELIWIKKDVPLTKASARQAGLYNAIKDLNLNVEKILQTWPIGSRYNVKSEIEFKELEESVKIK